MARNDYHVPDLASVLRTLSAYTGTPNQGQQAHPPPAQTPPLVHPVSSSFQQDEELEEGEYAPEDDHPNQGSFHHTYQSAPLFSSYPLNHIRPRSPPPLPSLQSQQSQSQHKLPTQTPAAVPPPIDPTTIVTWPVALRHVSRLMAKNDVVLERVRKLIDTQHQHERQWWDGRENLIKKQKDRVEERKKLDDVLRAVGGMISTSASIPTEADEANELLLYDKKVHRACSEMHRATEAELKALGIPFFGTSRSCLVPSSEQDENLPDTAELSSGKPRVSDTKLSELQRRMVKYLEELCEE
ncbi:hypothetical protein MMC25_004458 [Agyrium rufum]|nr:hypothetical protein [Agyrium rufum]